MATNQSFTLTFLAAEIDEHYHPQVELIGDLAHTLWMLNERISSVATISV